MAAGKEGMTFWQWRREVERCEAGYRIAIKQILEAEPGSYTITCRGCETAQEAALKVTQDTIKHLAEIRERYDKLNAD